MGRGLDQAQLNANKNTTAPGEVTKDMSREKKDQLRGREEKSNRNRKDEKAQDRESAVHGPWGLYLHYGGPLPSARNHPTGVSRQYGNTTIHGIRPHFPH